jgi:hypothetical protein
VNGAGTGTFGALDEGPHPQAAVEEWVVVAWAEDGASGLVSGYRIVRPARRNWYWAGLVRSGLPLLHVAEWAVPPRNDPLLVKADGLWAEHICDEPFQQWTFGNETYAAALADPEEALGRAYGEPTPIAWDLEWYATAPAAAIDQGYAQAGVIHGQVELPDGPLVMVEQPACRWHRWGEDLGPLARPVATAHLGLRAPFAFPDGTVSDWVLTPSGWCARG